jgi:hypothetical protein
MDEEISKLGMAYYEKRRDSLKGLLEKIASKLKEPVIIYDGEFHDTHPYPFEVILSLEPDGKIVEYGALTKGNDDGWRTGRGEPTEYTILDFLREKGRNEDFIKELLQYLIDIGY